MVLRMKNFNIFWFTEKSHFKGKQKTDIEGGIAKKGGLGQFANLRVGLGKKEGGVVSRGRGVDTVMHTI